MGKRAGGAREVVSIDDHQATPSLSTSFPGTLLSPLEGGTGFFTTSKFLNLSLIYG